MKNKNHKFTYADSDGWRKVYLVDCEKEGGQFSTNNWHRGIVKKNICPCCKEMVR